MTRAARSGAVFLIAAAAFIVISSCRRVAPDNVDRNRPPETYITRAPAESTVAYYRVRFYWGGADPDGDISYYEVAVTDSNRVPGEDTEGGTGYTRTLRTDSLFTFTNDPPVETQINGKRVYVRAVDNEGKIDPTPARAYFQARNDCYPTVDFHVGAATWTDKCGTIRETPLRSTNAVAPTDTVGVGSTVHWSWGGSDCDEGGYVTGFLYKLGSQPRYLGGTLADTSYTLTFPLNAGRVQLLQVRAIDDGGLRSRVNYTQSVVVNFDPITIAVDPVADDAHGNPVPARVFTWNTGTYPTGTWLPDTSPNVTVTFTGLDDPRDLQPSCQSTGLSRYQGRKAFRDDSFGNTTSPTWDDLTPREPYPTRNQFIYNSLGSGDHFIMIRSVDVSQVVDSTPETVLVKVNYPPYVTRLEARPSTLGDDAYVDLLSMTSGAVIPIHFPPGDSLLHIRTLGSDVHLVRPNTDPHDSVTVLAPENGVLAGNGYRTFLQTSAFEPSFDMSPPTGVPYENDLLLPIGPGESLEVPLVVDVVDLTFTNSKGGRTTRVIRRIRLER